MTKKKKHKWKYQVNIRKKILVLLILGVFLFIELGYTILESNLEIGGSIEVSKYDKKLYNVFKREANSGYAVKYNGLHQDSIDSSKSTEDIYHFYADTDEKGNDILNKNNVLFADTCWQMIRTTDTGGVKLLYNGTPEVIEENGIKKYNCGSTRNLYHIGNNKTTQNLSGTFIYAKNYTATTDGNNTTFTLVDDPNDPDDYVSIKINSTATAQSNIPNIVENYPYTCRNATGTCDQTKFYKVIGHSNGTIAYVNSTAYMNTIGNSVYNSTYNSVAYVGYMYGDVYANNTINSRFNADLTAPSNIYSSYGTLGTTWHYADSIDWNNLNPGKYTLIDSEQITSTTDYTTLVGQYVMNGTTSDSSVYYVIGKNGTRMYLKELSGGNQDISIVFADDITNGTTLVNPTTPIELKDYYTNHANYRKKYTCGSSATTCTSPNYITNTTSTSYTYMSGNITIAKTRNGLDLTDSVYTTISPKEWNNNYSAYKDYLYTCGNESTTCTEENLRYITAKTATSYTYIPNYYFGTSVKYENNKYVLQNVEQLDKIMDMSIIPTHHYMCLNRGKKECSSVAYIHYYTGTGSINYIELNNPDVTTVNDALDAMFKKNTTDSQIKKEVDSWYETHLKDTAYEQILDDTIYCNDRSYSTETNHTFNESGWNDNGGVTTKLLYFKENKRNNNDLSCNNITDRFSTSNNEAKLKYNIGLATSTELDLLGNNNSRKSITSYYWTLSPSDFDQNYGLWARTIRVNHAGTVEKQNVHVSHGIRPMITLIKDIKYETGNGTMTNPYIINVENS